MAISALLLLLHANPGLRDKGLQLVVLGAMKLSTLSCGTSQAQRSDWQVQVQHLGEEEAVVAASAQCAS